MIRIFASAMIVVITITIPNVSKDQVTGMQDQNSNKNYVLRTPPTASSQAPLVPFIRIEGGTKSMANPAFVLALSTGFAAVDQGDACVRFYDASGGYRGQVGRSGSGPGDFSPSITQILSIGHQVFVPDIRLRRLNVIDVKQLKWIEAVPFASGLDQPLWWAIAPPDHLIQVSTRVSVMPKPDFTVVSVRGAMREKVMSVVPRDSLPQSTWFGGMPLLGSGPEAGSFALVYPAHGQIEVRSLSGALTRSYGFEPSGGAKLTDAERAYFVGLARTEGESLRAKRVALLLDRVPERARERVKEQAAARGLTDGVGEHYPFFVDARFDEATGSIWVARPVTANQVQTSGRDLDWDTVRRIAVVWDAFARDGSFVRRVTLPFGVIITDIADNRMLGIQLRANGEADVVLFNAGSAK